MPLLRSTRLPRSGPHSTPRARLFGLVLAALSVAIAPRGKAQPRADHQVPGVSVAITAGPVGLPDALGAQCGSEANGAGGVGLEGGVALLARPARWLVLQLDGRAANQAPLGCTDIGVPADTVYARDLRRDPLPTATARVGIETPPGLPLARLTAGVGGVWGGRRLPLTVIGVAVGTRGRRVGFLLEAERYSTRVDARERVFHWETDGPTTVERLVSLRPTAYAVRVGVELRPGGPR